MALQLRSAIRDGVDAAASRNGLVLFVALTTVTLLQLGLIQLVGTTYVPLDPATTAPGADGAGAGGPAPGTELPPIVKIAATGIAAFTGGLFTIPVRVVAIRTFVSDYRERIPDPLVFHRLPRASLSVFLASTLVSIATVLAVFLPALAVGAASRFVSLPAVFAEMGTLPAIAVGVVLLVLIAVVVLLPAAYVGLGLMFATHEIVVRDRGVFAALSGSWRLARGHRLKLLVLALLPMLPQTLISFPVNAALAETVAMVVQSVATTVVTMFVMGIMAKAYVQVADGAPGSLPS